MTDRRGRSGLLVAVAVAVSAAGCSGDARESGSSGTASTHPAPLTRPPPPERAKSSADVVVTRDDGRLGRSCSPRRVARALADFFDAFNRGDRARLEALVADASRFQWYGVNQRGRLRSESFLAVGSVSDLPGAPAKSERPKLFPYFAARHRQHERLRLVTIAVTDIPPRTWFSKVNERVAGFQYTVVRTADDLARLGGGNRTGGGKGAISCRDKRLLLLIIGLGTRKPRRAAPLCPRPKRRAREGAAGRPRVVACTALGA